MSLKLNFTYQIYPDLTHPKGELPADKRAQACWTFYTLAEQVRIKVGKSTEDQFGLLEDFLWMDKNYIQIAKSVALRYGLESPSEFQKFWPYVRRQARVLELPEPHDEYTRPYPHTIIT